MAQAARLAMLVSLALSTGCASLSTFNTDPPGAKLYVNGRYLGQTPVQFTSPRSFGHRYHVQLMKDGYQAQDFYLDSRLSWVMGYLAPLFPPLLFWGWALDHTYDVRLPSLDEAAGAPAQPEAPVDDGAQPIQQVR